MNTLQHITILPLPGPGIIICRYHRYCIMPNGVAEHFKNLHAHDCTPDERRKMQDSVYAILDDLYATPSALKIPLEPIPAIEALALYTGSLKCNHCVQIYSGRTRTSEMKTHLREKHTIFASKAKAKREEKEGWWRQHWTTVSSQQYFTTGSGDMAKHFEVLPPDVGSPRRSISPENESTIPNSPIAEHVPTHVHPIQDSNTYGLSIIEKL